MQDPTTKIGQEIRRIRQEQGLTLEETALRTDVSKAMLGQIERGESNPTVSLLWKVASGLRVSLSSLLSPVETDYEVIDIDALPSIAAAEGKMQLKDVFAFNPISGFEYFYITLEPGAHHESVPHENASNEYIIVTEGTLTLTSAGRSYSLEAPAAVQFSPQFPHTYENNADQPAVFQNIVRY